MNISTYLVCAALFLVCAALFRRFACRPAAFLAVWGGQTGNQSDFLLCERVRREMGNPIHLCHPSLLTIEKPTFSTPILTLNPSPANQERGGGQSRPLTAKIDI